MFKSKIKCLTTNIRWIHENIDERRENAYIKND
jgi:hypothetical protein